jgi:hypothetical protein
VAPPEGETPPGGLGLVLIEVCPSKGFLDNNMLLKVWNIATSEYLEIKVEFNRGKYFCR